MASEYVDLIRELKRESLLEMLDRIRSRLPLEGWPPGRGFEYAVLRGFELEGFQVAYPFEVRDFGATLEQIDGAIHGSGISCIVESKDHTDPIDFEPVAKLKARLVRRPVSTFGLLFSVNGFTEPAKTLARFVTPLNVLFWEFEELRIAVKEGQVQGALMTKYRYAVQEGLPDFNVLRS